MNLRIFKVFLFLVCGVAVGLAFLWWQYREFLRRPLPITQERILVVAQGRSAGDIIAQLSEENIIANPMFMRYFLESESYSRKLQSGSFVLTVGMYPQDLAQALTRSGKYFERNVNISAGQNMYEIAQRLHSARIADAKSFLQTAQDRVFVADLGIPAQSVEGYLAPGAYHFKPSATPQEIIAQMHQRFLDTWKELVAKNRGLYERYRAQGFGDHELLTLASMVQKEAVLDAERPVIMRVFFNRLRTGMPLQSDPTCVYPPRFLGERPSPERCRQNDNMYSTYVIKALPPGPITTIGLAGLEAVFKPYEGTQYRELLYFVGKGDGSQRHYFSRTYAEHQKAVRYYLKKEKISLPRGTTQP